MRNGIILFSADTDARHTDAIHRGICDYVASAGPWVMHLGIPEGGIGWVRSKWPTWGCGVVGWFENEQRASALRNQGIPCMNLCESQPSLQPSPGVRFAGEGARAAAMLADELGYRHLAFVGSIKQPMAVRCHEEFVCEARARGTYVEHFEVVLEQDGMLWDDASALTTHEIERLVTGAPKPLGIFCPNRRHGYMVREVAKAVGCTVPMDVGIIAVGGEQAPRPQGRPELSVIEVSHYQQGFEAARMIAAHLLDGAALTELRLPPLRFRQGTSTVHSRRTVSHVERAMEIFQKSPAITVEELAAAVGVHRDTLDRQFKLCQGRPTIHALNEARCAFAAQLMKDFPYWNLESIAGVCGFRSRQDFRRCFQKWSGMPPKEFRELCRERRTPDRLIRDPLVERPMAVERTLSG